jgi:hypothetical protein
MLCLSTECYAKRALPQCVDVAIRQIASMEDGCLVTDVHSISSDMNAIGCHKCFSVPQFG